MSQVDNLSDRLNMTLRCYR